MQYIIKSWQTIHSYRQQIFTIKWLILIELLQDILSTDTDKIAKDRAQEFIKNIS